VTAARSKILVVEDDPLSRRVLTAMLAKAGYELLEATDGKTALAELERARPRVVITDWMMPVLDGLELTRRIRAAPDPTGYTYVIMITARSERAALAAALAAGVDEFLTKPLDQGELQARLATAERILGLEFALAARIGELERALEQVKASEARLVEAQRLAAIGEVGIAVRHEVNNPLTGIIGLVDLALLDRPRLSPDLAQSLEAIGGLAKRISRTVARLENPTSTRTTEYVPGTAMLDLGEKPQARSGP